VIEPGSSFSTGGVASGVVVFGAASSSMKNSRAPFATHGCASR
jgi:hypothetical protein